MGLLRHSSLTRGMCHYLQAFDNVGVLLPRLTPQYFERGAVGENYLMPTTGTQCNNVGNM